jgi:site-specific DNA-methyltransferase (adenine-specific)
MMHLDSLTPFFQQDEALVYEGDCLDVLSLLPEASVDMIFADPPYNLSNGGITCHAGRMVPVDKGEWDRSAGPARDHDFALQWLSACRRVLASNGTIWVSGTMHNIYSVGFALQELGFKLLNDISWFKPNASPNLSCRYFTHSHETLLWAAKSAGSRHVFNYSVMKEMAGGKQMRSLWPDVACDDGPGDVWAQGTPRREEKTHGKHPTQKPVGLLVRVVLASTKRGDLVLDPFAGSSTTGVGAVSHGRRYIGIENDPEYLKLSAERLRAALLCAPHILRTSDSVGQDLHYPIQLKVL